MPRRLEKLCEVRQRELTRRAANLQSSADALKAVLEGKPIQKLGDREWYDFDPLENYEAVELLTNPYCVFRPKP